MVNVYIKNMDAESYKEARKLAIDRGENVGEVFAEGILLLKKQMRQKEKKVNLKELLGFFGSDEKALDEERQALKGVRKKISKDIQERIGSLERQYGRKATA